MSKAILLNGEYIKSLSGEYNKLTIRLNVSEAGRRLNDIISWESYLEIIFNNTSSIVRYTPNQLVLRKNVVKAVVKNCEDKLITDPSITITYPYGLMELTTQLLHHIINRLTYHRYTGKAFIADSVLYEQW